MYRVIQALLVIGIVAGIGVGIAGIAHRRHHGCHGGWREHHGWHHHGGAHHGARHWGEDMHGWHPGQELGTGPAQWNPEKMRAFHERREAQMTERLAQACVQAIRAVERPAAGDFKTQSPVGEKNN